MIPYLFGYGGSYEYHIPTIFGRRIRKACEDGIIGVKRDYVAKKGGISGLMVNRYLVEKGFQSSIEGRQGYILDDNVTQYASSNPATSVTTWRLDFLFENMIKDGIIYYLEKIGDNDEW